MSDKISNILGIDIRQYLQDCVDYINQYNQILIGYVSNGTQYPRDAYILLDNLVARYREIVKRIGLRRDRLQGLQMFEIIDQVENIRSVLRSFDNYSRWMKSSFVKGRFTDSAEIVYVLKQNQTIENMALSVGYSSGENGFLDLTYRNKISERDYDLSGGLVFKFAYQNEQKMQLDTVIDNMTGDNLMGKDIKRKIQLIDDDLLYLSPQDTFMQTCEIFTALTKNSNPEFPVQGFSKESLTNRNGLSNMLPIFVRQMYSIVSSDDTIASFSIKSVSIENDALRIEMEFLSHLNTEAKQVVYGD